MEKLAPTNNFKSLLAKIKALPQPKTEESILLRILVQLMVIVAIVATDVAALNIFWMSTWAIPLSIVGAVVSWRRRKQKNIGIKFMLAIAMVATLVIFFGNLLSNINDTRLVLAEFLIQLQVLHSFDLPRRKDLGYSMVIALILIGVSATLSQTLAFAPWLLLLLVLAIPTLILDYRLQMGLTSWEKQWSKKSSISQSTSTKTSSLSLKKVGFYIAIIITLGLAIFAIMPRYPGYQIQSFPVSAPDGFENRDFTGADRSVVNPGYNPDGTPNGDLIGEGENGAGQQDDTSYYGFNTKINQNFSNTIGTKELLFRIRSQYPGYWRVLGFDHYTGQGWEILREEQTAEIKRNPWNYQFRLNVPPIKGETKKVIQTYTTVVNLPNIIPSLRYAQTIYFPATEIAVDSEGSLRSPSGLIDGLTYTTISRVPYRNQTQLQQAGDNYPDLIEKYYLSLPPEVKVRVKVKAEELLALADRELTSNYDRALYLAQAIKQNYSLQTDIPRLAEGEDLAEAFLEQNQGGYPDHFATVYTLMLRSLDIPSRLVVGFAPGRFNPFTGYYLVHNTDAYAMTEVYFPDYGWFYFDPLPGHDIIPVSFQDDNLFGVLGLLWKWVASWLPSPITAFITAVFSRISQAILSIFQAPWLAKLWQFITGSFIGVLLGFLGLIILSFIAWLLFKYFQKVWETRRLNKLHPMAKIYQQMLNLLQEKGHLKNKAQTPYQYSHSLSNVVESEQLEIINLITDNYVQWRYGKLTPNTERLRSQFALLQKSFDRNRQLTISN